MVIDSSALIAILEYEQDAPSFAAAIAADGKRLISAASVLEASLVIETRRGESGRRDLDLLLYRMRSEVVEFGSDQLSWARHAFRVFGKRRHAAGLNYGDCFSYALSQVSGEPLLFKGDDFSKTDVKVASSSAG